MINKLRGKLNNKKYLVEKKGKKNYVKCGINIKNINKKLF